MGELSPKFTAFRRNGNFHYNIFKKSFVHIFISIKSHKFKAIVYPIKLTLTLITAIVSHDCGNMDPEYLLIA